MFRSPTSHLVFDDKGLYRSHLNEIMWASELPWAELRRLKEKYREGRKELWSVTTFTAMKRWLDDNRDLVLRAPCLNIAARGNRAGKVTPYKEMVIEGTRYRQDIDTEIFHFLDNVYNDRITNKAGWMFRGYFIPQRGSDPRFSISDTCRALTAYGFYIIDYQHETRKDGNSVYAFQACILARDFKNLAMIEKLAGRASGNMAFVTA